MIGIDFAGIRLPKEHRKADTLCAASGTFVVENVHGLESFIIATGAKFYSTLLLDAPDRRIRPALQGDSLTLSGPCLTDRIDRK